jgi:Mg2+ and Co2+ transporter CorA
MMSYSEEDLDVTIQRIKNIEKELIFMREALTSHADSIKETQRYLIQLARNQSELTKRVSQWPYIPIPADREEE